MPALPPVANVVKLRLFWTIEGDPMAVTIKYFHYNTAAPADSDLIAWLAALETSADANLAPLFQSGVTLEGADARDLSNMAGAFAAATWAIAGTRTGTRLAPGTAAVKNYQVRQSYRGGKPRNYYPFGVSGDVATTGFWADAFVTAYSNGVDTFDGDGFGTFGDMTIDHAAVVSYYGPPNKLITNGTTGRVRTVSTRRDAPGGTGHPLVYLLTGSTGSKIIGSQRRRNRNA